MTKILKWGYIDRSGNMAIAPAFDGAWNFHEGLAAVKVEWARGYIDLSGVMVIEPKFQFAGPFLDGRARVMLDDVWGFTDRSGVFTPSVDAAGPAMVDDDAPAPSRWPEVFRSDNRCGYVDDSGQVVIPAKFAEAEPFCDGLARVRPSPSAKWSFISPDGNAAFPGKFVQAADFSEGLARVLVQL